jgi:hypothetical protein
LSTHTQIRLPTASHSGTSSHGNIEFGSVTLASRSVRHKPQIYSICSPFLDEGCFWSPVTVLNFCFGRATMSLPQTAPIVDDIFGPVTWHHQRRPFIRALTCKTTRPAGVPAEPPPTIKLVQYLCEEERERERERERMIDPAQIIFVPPFISLHAICPFCPCHAQGPMETSNIFSDLI